MSEGLTILFAAAGVVAAMLAVLLPVVLLQGKSLRREIDHLRTDIAADISTLRADMAADIRRCAPTWPNCAASSRVDTLTSRVDALTTRMDALTTRVDTLTSRVEGVSERAARLEGALIGPWRPPTNGNPAPAPSGTEVNA